MDGGAQAVAQLRQGGVGPLGDQHDQAGAAGLVHLGGGAAGVRLGGERAGLAAALQQAADPGGADAEQVRDLLPCPAALVAGTDDFFAEVLGVRFHTQLDETPLQTDATRSNRAGASHYLEATYDEYALS